MEAVAGKGGARRRGPVTCETTIGLFARVSRAFGAPRPDACHGVGDGLDQLVSAAEIEARSAERRAAPRWTGIRLYSAWFPFHETGVNWFLYADGSATRTDRSGTRAFTLDEAARAAVARIVASAEFADGMQGGWACPKPTDVLQSLSISFPGGGWEQDITGCPVGAHVNP